MLLASPALAAETARAGTDRADAALQTARATITRLEDQLKGLNLRATRSARATAADAPAPFAPDRRSLAEDDGYLMCDLMDKAMQCGMKNTQATCEANTNCAWLADEEECTLSDEVSNEIGTELTAGVMSLFGPMMTCGSSTPTDCPADQCVVYGKTCSVSDAAVDSAYEDASIAEIMKMSIKCGVHQSENSCEANPECTWSMQDEADYEEPVETCRPGDDANLLVVAKYCEADAEFLSTDESCEIFGLSLSCGMAEDESSCATSCAWIVGDADSNNPVDQDDRCDVSTADGDAIDASISAGFAALIPSLVACALFDEDSCSGSCGWGFPLFGDDSDDERRRSLLQEFDGVMCLPNPGNVQQVLIAANADPRTRGYLGWVFNLGATCHAETDETKCNALEGCMYGADNYDDDNDGEEHCYAPERAAMLSVNNKCSGSASDVLVALANAEAEDGSAAITLDQIYTEYGVTDLTDSSKLAAAADIAIRNAETKTKLAEEKYNDLITASSDLTEDEAAEVKVLAEAATLGLPVKKIVVTIDAADASTACSSLFTKFGLTPDDGACTATAERRRRLLADFSAKVLINPAKVDAAAADAAIASLKADLGDAAVDDSDVNAVSEMETIDNLDTTTLASFKTASKEAATANIEAEAYLAEVGLLCAANQYVASNVCTACAAGTTNAAGDDASGSDTTCTATLCAANQYVASNVCTACAAGTTNAAGDDASGSDTTCAELGLVDTESAASSVAAVSAIATAALAAAACVLA